MTPVLVCIMQSCTHSVLMLVTMAACAVCTTVPVVSEHITPLRTGTMFHQLLHLLVSRGCMCRQCCSPPPPAASDASAVVLLLQAPCGAQARLQGMVCFLLWHGCSCLPTGVRAPTTPVVILLPAWQVYECPLYFQSDWLNHFYDHLAKQQLLQRPQQQDGGGSEGTCSPVSCSDYRFVYMVGTRSVSFATRPLSIALTFATQPLGGHEDCCSHSELCADVCVSVPLSQCSSRVTAQPCSHPLCRAPRARGPRCTPTCCAPTPGVPTWPAGRGVCVTVCVCVCARARVL